MSFDQSREQTLLRDSIKEYAVRNCPYDKLHQILDSDSGFDDELWHGLIEGGVELDPLAAQGVTEQQLS